MTLQNLYIKLKKNKITKTQFLNEVRKDPFASKFVSSTNSYEDVIKILKSREIIREMQQKVESFNLNRYLREMEDQAPYGKQKSEEKPEDEASDETLPAELEDAVSRFIRRIEQSSDYNSYENVVLMIAEIVRAMKLGKQSTIAVLNSVKSKFI